MFRHLQSAMQCFRCSNDLKSSFASKATQKLQQWATKIIAAITGVYMSISTTNQRKGIRSKTATDCLEHDDSIWIISCG